MKLTGPLLTDLYQLTMLQGYFDHGMNEDAVFEFFVRRLPAQRNFLVAAGLGFATHFLWDLTRPVSAATDNNVQAALKAARVAIV
jgi:nicotinate phosphoribosyltransferase